ncbi:major capsid protein [Apis mellifera associated microvirus 34]|nr:major capsid protein [Apis mellifera associated microvirus 34]
MSRYKGFSAVEFRKPERSLFDLSHEKKFSTRMGKLVPIACMEVLPNDTVRMNSEVMLRLAPLLAPIYHNVNVFVHHFYVPTRILYKDWEKFITHGRLGTETPPIPPYLPQQSILSQSPDVSMVDVGSLGDFLGLNPIRAADVGDWLVDGPDRYRFNALPWAAYQKIWYDYYRDRNFVEDKELFPLPSGDITSHLNGAATGYGVAHFMAMKNRAWKHDYFMSALPWTQRGDEVLMPLAGNASWTYRDVATVTKDGEPWSAFTVLGTSGSPNLQDVDGTGTDQLSIDNIEDIALTSSSVSINDLRSAIRLQEWMEKSAVAGSRLNETILAHFARRTSDGRLQRAEYLGGGRVHVKISEVMTTAYSMDSEGTTVPPANMTGRGMTFNDRNRFVYNCEEWGFVISIMSVMPEPAYMNGSHRMFFNRNTFLDYPWPSFAHLGEQPVYKYEIYSDHNTVPVTSETEEDIELFGYQSRYADWKYQYSTVHGDMRTSLDFWHLAMKFDSAPNLGANFITFPDELQDRIFAVSGVDTLWCLVFNNVKVSRSLPYYGKPTI